MEEWEKQEQEDDKFIRKIGLQKIIEGIAVSAYLNQSDARKGMYQFISNWAKEAKSRVRPTQITLTVKVLKCRNLENADGVGAGKSDPYVIVQCGTEKKQTKVIEDELDPRFGETFTFNVNLQNFTEFKAIVMDKDNGSKDDTLGETTIELKSIPLHKTQKDWRKLQLEGVSKKGEILLEIVAVPYIPPKPKSVKVNVVGCRNLESKDVTGKSD
eukprot:PhF_6_TR33648/c0_g2_i2/m.49211/K19907/SYT7; synaptotagmin-7